MAYRLSTLVTIAAASGMLTVSVAAAQTTKKVHAAKPARNVVLAEISDTTEGRPLTVKKRSFLDPGNAVPVGSATPEYISANTSELRNVYTTFAPAFFGESELPGRFDLPPSNPRFNPSAEPRLPLPFDE
jgi:hypothetical protein